MSVKTVEYRQNLSANTDRGPSRNIWADCPIPLLIEDPDKGMYWFDDFQMAGQAVMSSAYKNSIGAWSVYADAGALLQNGNDTSGTVADVEGGVINISSDGDDEGVTLFSSAGATRFITANSTTAPNYQDRIWFEARFSRSTIAATKVDVFVGLCSPILSSGVAQAAQPISTTINALSTTPSFLGFHSSGSTASTPGGPTEVAVAFNKASGTVNYPTNLTACMAATGQTVLAAGAFVKVGFVFDRGAYAKAVSSATARQTAGNIRKPIIRFFINGLECPAFLTSDDIANATSGQAFPIGFLAPCLAVMNCAGSSPGSLSVDWVRIAQLANT